jgi:Uma2 family endonuclease
MRCPMEALTPHDTHYPDSDGQPMADNTLQFRWIVTIKENLDTLLPDFVGGDLLWYPVKGDPKTRLAPDALVALGRPKGDRGSYRQWEEADIPPQIVFEILSPSNTFPEMMRKLRFYDPDGDLLEGWARTDTHQQMQQIPNLHGWISPLLGIRFDTSGPELVIYRPDGTPFLTFAEAVTAREAAETAREAAETAREAAETAREAAEARAAVLEARLRALGLDPETL